MWSIVTYKETGKWHEFQGRKIFQHMDESWEDISDDLETAIDELTGRYPRGEKYHHGIVWQGHDKWIFVEEAVFDKERDTRYLATVATLRKRK